MSEGLSQLRLPLRIPKLYKQTGILSQLLRD